MRPFPQHISYAAGSLKPSERSQSALDNDVRSAYDRWKAHCLAVAAPGVGGAARYRVKFGLEANAPTVSEGQGYGMLLVALMAGHDPDARTVFDGLFRFSFDHRSAIDPRLTDFWVNGDESPDDKGDDTAFDGDADIAYALLLADAQWGSEGDINYRGEALTVLQGQLESVVGPTSHLPLLGDFVDPNGDVVNEYTPRSSDFMPGHFRAFARATGNGVWAQVTAATQAAITDVQTNHSPVTGLLPDFLVPESTEDHRLKPAPPDFLEGPNDGRYSYNAGRDPWRIGTDWLLNQSVESRTQVQTISNWAATSTGNDPLQVKPGYLLDGSPIPPGDYFSSFYAAPLGVAAMCTPGQQAWLNAIYEAVREREEGYYEDSVTLLCMLVMTGNFWDPTV
jgi:endo-1,4-beta-D-glucanase Y